MSHFQSQIDNIELFANVKSRQHAICAKTQIVVPCYNEEVRLDADAFISFLQVAHDVSLVFVNDGSTDRTLDSLIALHDRVPDRITVVDLEQNAGKAEAVRQGLIVASDEGADFVGYWDADLATPLDAILDFTRIMDKFEDTSVIYGARRALLGHRIERTVSRRIVSRVCAALARQAIRLPVGDTQCGAKLFRNTPVLQLAIATPFTAGWLFDVELFTRLSAQITDPRHAFYEQPLAEWSEVAGSKVSSQAILKSGFRMLAMIAEYRFGITLLPPIIQNPTSARVMTTAPQTIIAKAA